jgi:hypothetical protein
MRHPQTWKLAMGTTAGSSRILRARHERPHYCRDMPKGEARLWPARVLPRWLVTPHHVFFRGRGAVVAEIGLEGAEDQFRPRI